LVASLKCSASEATSSAIVLEVKELCLWGSEDSSPSVFLRRGFLVGLLILTKSPLLGGLVVTISLECSAVEATSSALVLEVKELCLWGNLLESSPPRFLVKGLGLEETFGVVETVSGKMVVVDLEDRMLGLLRAPKRLILGTLSSSSSVASVTGRGAVVVRGLLSVT